MYEEPDISKTTRKIFLLLMLIGILFLVILFTVTAGCITAAKTTYKDMTATPMPTPTPLPPTPEPTPTPIPEPTLSESQLMEMNGGLKMGTWYSWRRENVSGLKDMNTHVTVYGYKILGTIEWRSVSWGQYFRSGAGIEKKFLFVYVKSWSDDGTSHMWGIQPHQFTAAVKGVSYNQTDEVLPQIRIKDLDETWNMDHVEGIKPYGCIRMYSSEGQEICPELGYLKDGKSNAWDGYLVFSIPADAQPKDIKIMGNFHNLAESHWWQLE